MLSWLLFLTIGINLDVSEVRNEAMSAASLGLKTFEKVAASKNVFSRPEDFSDFENQMARMIASFELSEDSDFKIETYDFSKLKGGIYGVELSFLKKEEEISAGLPLISIFFEERSQESQKLFALSFSCDYLKTQDAEHSKSVLVCEVVDLARAKLTQLTEEAAQNSRSQPRFASFHFLKTLREALFDRRVNEVKDPILRVKVWRDRSNIRAKTEFFENDQKLFSYCHYHGRDNFDCHSSSRAGQNEPVAVLPKLDEEP
jgi:hypothetical protein